MKGPKPIILFCLLALVFPACTNNSSALSLIGVAPFNPKSVTSRENGRLLAELRLARAIDAAEGQLGTIQINPGSSNIIARVNSRSSITGFTLPQPFERGKWVCYEVNWKSSSSNLKSSRKILTTFEVEVNDVDDDLTVHLSRSVSEKMEKYIRDMKLSSAEWKQTLVDSRYEFFEGSLKMRGRMRVEVLE